MTDDSGVDGLVADDETLIDREPVDLVVDGTDPADITVRRLKSNF